MAYGFLKGVVGIACAVTGMDISDAMHRSVRGAVDSTISVKVADEFRSEEAAAIRSLNQVKADISALNKEETMKIENRLVNDDLYLQHKANADAAKASMDSLKSALKNFEADKTQVAVGSGDSAVAVNITNTAAKTKLEADISAAKATYDSNLASCNRIRSRVRNEVISERTDEQRKLFALKDEKEADLNDIYSKESSMETSIRNDDKFMLKESYKAIRENYSYGKIIASAGLKSVIPALMLYKTWSVAIKDIKLLNLAKGAV